MDGEKYFLKKLIVIRIIGKNISFGAKFWERNFFRNIHVFSTVSLFTLPLKNIQIKATSVLATM